jgi:hypothetical protein
MNILGYKIDNELEFAIFKDRVKKALEDNIYQSIAKRATAGLTDKEAENLALLEKQLVEVIKQVYATPQEKPPEKPKKNEDKPFEL